MDDLKPIEGIKIEQKTEPPKEPVAPIGKYEFDLKEGWQERILSFYRQGYTDQEVAAEIQKERGIFNVNAFNRWVKKYPEFGEVIQKGVVYKQAWWLNQGRENIGNSKFNTPLYIRMMLNLFSWKTEATNSSETSPADLKKLNDEELKAYYDLKRKMNTENQNDEPKVKSNVPQAYTLSSIVRPSGN